MTQIKAGVMLNIMLNFSPKIRPVGMLISVIKKEETCNQLKCFSRFRKTFELNGIRKPETDF